MIHSATHCIETKSLCHGSLRPFHTNINICLTVPDRRLRAVKMLGSIMRSRTTLFPPLRSKHCRQQCKGRADEPSSIIYSRSSGLVWVSQVGLLAGFCLVSPMLSPSHIFPALQLVQERCCNSSNTKLRTLKRGYDSHTTKVSRNYQGEQAMVDESQPNMGR